MYLYLRDGLVKSFDKNELNILCADITETLNRDGVQQRVDLEIVGGETLANQALNLIKRLERRGLLSYLMDAANAARPGFLESTKER